MTVEQIASEIKQKTAGRKPTLIAIEGFGGSGKTTFATRLRDALGKAYIVNIDDFIVKEKLTESSWDKGGFDRERLERQVLQPASKQELVQYQELIWETNTLSEPKVVPEVNYLIIEGISCYHPRIQHYYDYKIWVDTPIEVAKARGKKRDAGNENADKWDMWAENDLAYQAKYHPESKADFVIDTAGDKQ
ncbi:MAG: putative phosphoribulokinase [Candidatus Saccharibacteria bacterium]|nr:putative phosphoribulokinase [Candidatus Saccharibacteria bacterium]